MLGPDVPLDMPGTLSIPVIARATGSPITSATNVQYAIWPDAALGAIGAPQLQGNAETTDGTGEFDLDVTGQFNVSDIVLVGMFVTGEGYDLNQVVVT